MSGTLTQSLFGAVTGRQTLEATIVRACRTCGPSGDPVRGQDGTAYCARCGAPRSAEPQGVIWRRDVVHLSRVGRALERFGSLFRRIRA